MYCVSHTNLVNEHQVRDRGAHPIHDLPSGEKMCASAENYTLSTAHLLEFQPFIVFELLYNSVNGRSLIHSVCLVDGTPHPLMEHVHIYFIVHDL